jgi:uncharacterized protein YcbX
MPTCVVPVTTAGKQVRVRVWDDHCQGYDQGDEVAKWLSTFLEEVRVMRNERLGELFTGDGEPTFCSFSFGLSIIGRLAIGANR